MCQEVLKMVQKMNKKHIETKLAIQCAPVIAGIKLSNLLILKKVEEKSLPYFLRHTGIVFLKLLNQGVIKPSSAGRSER